MTTFDMNTLDMSTYHKIAPGVDAENMSGTSADICRQALRTCQQHPGLNKAYVRGSPAHGDIDPYSDIDLLCVVAPEEFASFTKQVDDGIKEQYDAVAEGWVRTDAIVKDSGGVAFTYLLETAKGLHQLDLYVACQGIPSLDYLNHLPYKQEIFRKEDGNSLHYRLYSETVKPSVSRALTELSILGFMIWRCLERGNEFVASNEYNMWKNHFIKLVRHKFDTQHRDHGFYHVNRLSTEANDNGTLYEDLRAINNHTPSREKFSHAYRYAVDFTRKHFPKDYARQRKMTHAITRHIEGRKS
jgi:predicted nucleotidyltransferase